jgi:hypothetical protein
MKVYMTGSPDGMLRSFAPGFSRLGSPIPVADKSSADHLRKHNYELAKTKAEVIGEYQFVLKKTYEAVTKAVVSAAAAVYCIVQVATGGGGVTFVYGGMLATMAAVYYWWRSGAAFSNWQEFEMRPILLPIEDIAVEQQTANSPPAKGN